MPARPLTTLLLSSAVALGLSASADAATVVTKVVDGDTVKLREGKRAKTVDLLGVAVPACHAAEAKKALQRLLPARATVRIKADGTGKGRYVYRGSKLINAALLREGGAQTAGLQGLKLASSLSSAEQAAKTANRGLWTACPAPPTQTPTPPPTESAPAERARKDLAGRVFTRITATTFSSAESNLHLCSDGRFVEDVSTSSEFGVATSARYGGRWEVIAAEYRSDQATARVRRLNDDGSEGFVDFVATASGVTVNGASVSAQMSGVCT